MKDRIALDYAFAAQHDITIEEARAYRMGWEANERGSLLVTSSLMDRHDAWYSAGWADADIAKGRSVIEGRAA